MIVVGIVLSVLGVLLLLRLHGLLRDLRQDQRDLHASGQNGGAREALAYLVFVAKRRVVFAFFVAFSPMFYIWLPTRELRLRGAIVSLVVVVVAEVVMLFQIAARQRRERAVLGAIHAAHKKGKH